MSRPDLRFVAFLLAFAPLLAAATQVQVVGLFPGAAVLNVDGQYTLSHPPRSGHTGCR